MIFWTTLLGALLLIAVYAYLYHMIGTIGQNISLLQSQTQVLETQQSEVDQLKKNLAATQVSQQTLQSYFIDASDIVPFLETLEGYGKNANVVVKYQTVQIAGSPAELEVALTADGSFVDVYRFIASLEAAPYEFSITSATVESQGPNPDPNAKGPQVITWDAAINLSVASISGVSAKTATPIAVPAQ
jgi:Tfp pilus assembly protein PilN